MIEAYVQGQKLRIYTPLIAADTIKYITGKAEFEGNTWQEFPLRWIHFRKGEIVYDIPLTNNRFEESAQLNLAAGDWETYITGTDEDGERRITSSTAILTVVLSGLRDAPLHALPMSVAENIDAKSSKALSTANSIKQRADEGEFDGKDGTSFVVKGYFTSEDELPENGNAGDMYGVGTEEPYDMYAWDDVHKVWVNNGNIQGVQGTPGEDGADGKYPIPSLSSAGVLSWSWSDGTEEGLPEEQDIRGPQGIQGEDGEQGKSAYQTAVDAGYEGDEEGFNNLLANFMSHAGTHKDGGSDALENNSISREMLQAGATHAKTTVTLAPTSWQEKTQTVSAEGVTASNTVIVSPDPDSFTKYTEAQIRAIAQGVGTLTFLCETVPTGNVTANIVVLT